MRLSNDVYEEIKNVVIESFLEYDIKTIPISAFEMAIKMGITVIPYSALSEKKQRAAFKISEDGYSVEKNNGEWIIYYNDFCSSYGRINHTIMHEIGHYALGHIQEGEQEEAEAKFFAKYALAPPPLIHCIKTGINAESIADTFDISYEAAVYAYQYYRNWLRYGGHDYTEYEIKMLELFNVA